MLGLPSKAEVSKMLPKKAIYEKFNMNTAQKAKFDTDISRINIVGEITPATVQIAEGKTVQCFYILQIILKNKKYDENSTVKEGSVIYLPKKTYEEKLITDKKTALGLKKLEDKEIKLTPKEISLRDKI